MAFAFTLRSHPGIISTAPCNRALSFVSAKEQRISTLEFPCQQTNAGDWINCDLGTPIRISL